MEKYKNKYRIPSHRMSQWDYSSNGAYFITLVTQNRDCNLGCVEGLYVKLSDFGEIVNEQWLQSFAMRSELFLDEYIIMPNHLHGIVVLNNEVDETIITDETTVMDETTVETHGRASLQPPQPSPSFIRKPKSISSFIAGFKSVINSKIDDYIDANNLDIPKYNRNNHFFQANYYDHIIRNAIEYQQIKEYIINNPTKWMEDKLNEIK